MKILEVNCRRRSDGRYTHQSRIIGSSKIITGGSDTLYNDYGTI